MHPVLSCAALCFIWSPAVSTRTPTVPWFTISAPAPVWPPRLLPPLPILRGMFVPPVAPYLHVTLRRRVVSLAGQIEGFSQNFPPLWGKWKPIQFSTILKWPFNKVKKSTLYFFLWLCHLFLKVSSGVIPFIQEHYTSLTAYFPPSALCKFNLSISAANTLLTWQAGTLSFSIHYIIPFVSWKSSPNQKSNYVCVTSSCHDSSETLPLSVPF